MSLPVSIALRAEQDVTLQYAWYVQNAGLDVAERYLLAVDETIRELAVHPGIGLRRQFKSPELAGIRSVTVARPFDKHLIFYQGGTELAIERIMHGARDLPQRLLEEPEA